MASFAEQVAAARAAHVAASTLEAFVRGQIEKTFDSWEKGDISSQQVRHALENVVRGSYRTSAALALTHAKNQSELPGWKPKNQIKTTGYLTDMLSDVRRNLRDYKASDQDDKARRRAISRIQHSAGVGAQRGYTDSLISAYDELDKQGVDVRKVWSANFINNVPCKFCRALHGTSVKLHDSFPSNVGADTAKVYRDLQGPPRHPRCQCYLVMIVMTLDNAFDTLDLDAPSKAPAVATAQQVKDMPEAVFRSIVAALTVVKASS